MSEFDCGWVQDESDETVAYCECESCGRMVFCRKVGNQMLCSRCIAEQEIFEIVRKSYMESNQDYLKAQVKAALKESMLSKQETLNGLIDWIVNAGCAGMNDYYKKFVFSAIGHLLK